jgi:hypothetical protein
MNLADAFDEIQPTNLRNVCMMRTVFAQLDSDDRATLQAMLDDSDVQTSRITAALRLLEIDVASHVVGRHRRGICRCER